MPARRIRRRVPSSSGRDAAVATPARTSRIAWLTTVVFYFVFQLAILETVASKIDGGWDTEPNTQYHIQTDEGPERYFKYQTISGQYRKERRLQDGSVVGTYGWVDADGYLRLNDYVADSKGYRIVKNKKLFVGTQAPVGQAVSAAKYAPAAAGTAVSVSPYRSASAAAQAVVQATQAPPRQSSWRGSPFVYPSDSDSSPLRFPSSGLSNGLSSSTPSSSSHRSAAVAAQYRRPQSGYSAVRPVDVNSIADDDDSGRASPAPYGRRSSTASVPSPLPPIVAVTPPPAAAQSAVRPHTFRPAYRKVVQVQRGDEDAAAQGSEPAPGYDGVSFVRNGFRYYLPRHYHEERTDDAAGDTRTGSFGYVDPFGIRRVVYYNTAPGTGFVHRKNNRYVGLDAEPYDPRPPQ